MDHILKAGNLTKLYGDRIVVDHVDLKVTGGEIFGLFGPNGSGKSTILRMLTGITKPSKGRISVQVNGKATDIIEDPMAIREHASILTETPALYENMELYQYLRFYSRLSRIPDDDLSQKVLEAVTIVGMEDHLYRPLRQMSMGERQRVELARVLLKDSPILFLDEPFNGIDITTRREIRDYLKNNWLNENRCVFFTSHNLLESEHFVDRFSFIYQGRIIASGDENELKERFSTTRYSIHCVEEPAQKKKHVPPGIPIEDVLEEDLPIISVPQRALQILVSGGLIEEGEVIGNRVIVTLSGKSELDTVIQALVQNRISFHEVHPVGTIEDIFIRLLDEKKKEEGLGWNHYHDDEYQEPVQEEIVSVPEETPIGHDEPLTEHEFPQIETRTEEAEETIHTHDDWRPIVSKESQAVKEAAGPAPWEDQTTMEPSKASLVEPTTEPPMEPTKERTTEPTVISTSDPAMDQTMEPKTYRIKEPKKEKDSVEDEDSSESDGASEPEVNQ